MFNLFRKPQNQSILACDTQILGSAIFVIAEQVAPTFTRTFTANRKPSSGEVLTQIKLELCALYLHVFDRDALLEGGREAQSRFSKGLFDEVCRQVKENLGIERSEFGAFYNERQLEFSRYKELLAPWGQLGGTLFWEFGKRLASQYEAFNPVALQVFILCATDGYLSLRKQSTIQGFGQASSP